VRVKRLSGRYRKAVEALLMEDREVNLFLLGFLDAQPLDRLYWCGVVDKAAVRAVTLVVPGRLVVPYAPQPEQAASMGLFLRSRYRPCMVIGPREASDHLWRGWAPGAATDCYFDQRHYVATEAPPGSPPRGFRRAEPSEWREISRHAGRMEEEDLGHNPVVHDTVHHETAVRYRLKMGRTWMIDRDGEIVFLINVGTVTRWGSQVGGTFVPGPHRGRGLATAGMRALLQHLLPEHHLVTLHVNEANLPAVRVYEKAGFVRHAPFRLIRPRS